MERRKFLIGAGSLAAGSAAAIGTGAVSSITADRDVNLRIASDANAYLGLEAVDSDFVSENNKGVLEFDFTSTGNGANGINNRADTTFSDLFKITNQSDNGLYITAALAAPDGTAIDPTSGGARSVELLASGDERSGVDITYHNNTASGEPNDDGDEVVPPKSDFSETSRALGQTSTTGSIALGTGHSTEVNLRFLVYGSGGPRDTPFRVVLKAVKSDPAPSGKSDHMIEVNGDPS